MTEHTTERQPGGRAPAPGDLALVQSFLNTRWELARDHEEQFGNPAKLARWLVDHGLLEPRASLSDADLGRAVDAREGLRALLFVNNGAAADHAAVERLNRALRRSGLGLEFGPGGQPAFTAHQHGLDGALASIAAIVAIAQIDRRWSRMKACRGRHCGWAFYDHSRNQSGNWCSMAVCGSRAKAREYRRRKAGPPASVGQDRTAG